jgi:D-amino-acid dehydrogenase
MSDLPEATQITAYEMFIEPVYYVYCLHPTTRSSTPWGTKEIRLSGFAEFAGFDKTLELIRGKALVRAALPYFPRDSLLVDQAKYWTGFRPVTPDDVPVIGRLTPYQNLFVNTGHGSKGWTLSCGSSSLLAKIVAGETLGNFEPNSFNPNRFK